MWLWLSVAWAVPDLSAYATPIDAEQLEDLGPRLGCKSTLRKRGARRARCKVEGGRRTLEWDKQGQLRHVWTQDALRGDTEWKLSWTDGAVYLEFGLTRPTLVLDRTTGQVSHAEWNGSVLVPHGDCLVSYPVPGLSYCFNGGQVEADWRETPLPDPVLPPLRALLPN